MRSKVSLKRFSIPENLFLSMNTLYNRKKKEEKNNENRVPSTVI